MRPLEPYEGACCYRITRCPIGCAHDMVRPSISTPPITENTTFTADWLDPATIDCPQLKIGFAARKQGIADKLASCLKDI